MTEEIALGEGWRIEIDLGQKHNLVRLFNSDGVRIDEQEFTKSFWRRKRKRKGFENFITDTLEDFTDQKTPDLDSEKLRDIRMSISQAWEEKDFAENGELDLPIKDEEEPKEIKHAGEEVLHSPLLLQMIHDAIHKEQGIVGETANGLLTFFVMLSTLSEEPINMRISGRGSTGKSTIVVAVSKLFPQDKVMSFTSPTKKSLYYDEELTKEMDEKNRFLDARGKILIIKEEENAEDFLNEIKELLGHDDMLSDMPFAVGGGGGSPTTHHLHIYGWPSYVGVTTKPVQEETQSSRTLLITPNRGPKKYSAANERDAFEDSFPWFKHGNWRTRIIREAVKNLERYKVWNPFSIFVEEKFPSHKKARMMRDWDRLSSLMKTVTMLFQERRKLVEIKGEEHLVTSPIDVEIALEVAKNAMVEAIQGLDQDVREFYLHLRSRSFEELKGYKDLISQYSEKFNEDINRTTLRERYIKKLEDRGLIEIDQSTKPYTFFISAIDLEKMEDLRKKLGKMCTKEMKEKVKSVVLERLEGEEEIKQRSVAKGLYENYEIDLANPGISKEEPDTRQRFDEEYKEKIINILEQSFSLSISENSKVKKPLKQGDYWINNGGNFKSKSSNSSKSKQESKEDEEPPDFTEQGDDTSYIGMGETAVEVLEKFEDKYGNERPYVEDAVTVLSDYLNYGENKIRENLERLAKKGKIVLEREEFG